MKMYNVNLTNLKIKLNLFNYYKDYIRIKLSQTLIVFTCKNT